MRGLWMGRRNFSRMLLWQAASAVRVGVSLTAYGQETETDCSDRTRWVGVPRGDEGQCHCPGAQAELRPIARGVSEHADSHLRPARGPARRADGEQRSRTSEY